MRFDRRRWIASGIILAFIYFLAIFGLWISYLVPLVGTALFLAGLMVWYIAGIALSWSGLFVFHEFGASPVNWAGHVAMFVFYAAVACLLSWPFGGKKRKRRGGKGL